MKIHVYSDMNISVKTTYYNISVLVIAHLQIRIIYIFMKEKKIPILFQFFGN
jgi:hypothetical protein